MTEITDFLPLEALQVAFGNKLERDVPLARFTSARVGGPADAYLPVHSRDELAEAVSQLWQLRAPFIVLGGGSNMLVSDAGVRAVVVHNQARRVRFDDDARPPSVWAESGAGFGVVARQAAAHGLAGLEWAAGIPGTVGGAVSGNAGAHGCDVAAVLSVAEILHTQDVPAGVQIVRERWTPEHFEFGYRTSALKQGESGERNASSGHAPQAVVLAAVFRLERSTSQAVRRRMDELAAYRRRTQPPGASMGSMFKNPAGDYAGRLIEAAGLKGVRIGNAEISPLHANFFINHGDASARDIFALVQLARQAVADKFGVQLELEIELLGEW